MTPPREKAADYRVAPRRQFGRPAARGAYPQVAGVPCEHMFVSIKGSSYSRFQRALESGDLRVVRLAALELPYVNLTDALAICLLMRQRGNGVFERAAVRWLARLSLERPEITLADLRAAAAALMELPSAQARAKLEDLAARLRLPGIDRVLRDPG